MSRVNWRRVEEVYCRAVERDPAAWPALLDALCAGDPPEVRSRVEALLGSEMGRGESPVSGARSMIPALFGDLARSILAERVLEPGTRLHDRYTIVSVIATGGLGVVYEAIDCNFETPRPVAIKTISADLMMLAERRKRWHG
jgi:hypothetical protein